VHDLQPDPALGGDRKLAPGNIAELGQIVGGARRKDQRDGQQGGKETGKSTHGAM